MKSWLYQTGVRNKTDSFFDRRSELLQLFVLMVMVGTVALFFLSPFPQEFPMDDTYIHFVYAENLAEGRGLYFSFPEEQGVGTTSISWVAILAVGHRLGLSMLLLAKCLGLITLLVTSIGVFLLLKPLLDPRLAWVGALLVGLSGNMLWFALSGMETMLFVALGVLALLAYRHQQWPLMGILLGCLTLTRPEGIILTGAVGILELLRGRRITRGLLITGGVCALLASPWYGYLFLRTGHLLPTSAVGKQFTYQVGMQFVLDARPGINWLGKVPALVYLGSWVIYLLEFTLGGMSLPAPHVPLASVAEDLTYSVSLWAIGSWGIALFLIVAGARRILRPAHWHAWLQDPERRPWLLFLLWIGLHNLVFMIWIPVPGTASRYGAINHVGLWLTIVAGLATLRDRRVLFPILLSCVLLIAGVNTFYWDGVYEANLEHMRAVRMAAAEYVRTELPPNSRCAASDVGAIRYFSQAPIIDMGALVNPDVDRWFLEGESDEYLLENGATCLVVPGRANESGEGWFDIIDIMGLSESPLLSLEQQAAFEIEHERWLLGYLPTNNYQASVVIYNVVPCEPTCTDEP